MEGEYGKYFYLKDKSDELPTNVRSYFGGTVWEDLPGTGKQYLHLFHKNSQILTGRIQRLEKKYIKI